MAILMIGETDYSGNIVVGSYNVNSEDIYTSFTDANGREHRKYVRKKVSGSFEMEFPTPMGYKNFVDHLNANKKASGGISAYLFVNNLWHNETCELFFDFKPTLGRDNNNTRNSVLKFTVEVSER